MWRTTYQGNTGNWTKEEPWGQIGEVVWQYNTENGTAYSVSYHGDKFDFEELNHINLLFNKSNDGINWEPVDAEKPISYVGGTTETGW